MAAWKLIDTTLREGEQFLSARFTTEAKLEIARAVDALGVDRIEITNPAASPRSRSDAVKLAGLGLRAPVITHARCNVDDVRTAIELALSAGLEVRFSTEDTFRSDRSDLLRVYEAARWVARWDSTVTTTRDARSPLRWRRCAPAHAGST